MDKVFCVFLDLLNNIYMKSNISCVLSNKRIFLLFVLIIVIVVFIFIVGGRIKIKDLEIESDGINRLIISISELIRKSSEYNKDNSKTKDKINKK